MSTVAQAPRVVVGAAPSPGLRRLVVTDVVMGTRAIVHVIVREQCERWVAAEVADAAGLALAALHEADHRFSPFRADSEISRLARGDLRAEDVHPDVQEVQHACLSARRATRRLFDAWWRGWFDPTGYVKGWAADRAVESHLLALLSLDDVAAVGLNVGGDLRVATAPGADWRWRVGIVDPADRCRVLASLEVVDGGVATSGTAERGAHIVDPRTKEPCLAVASATVVAGTLAAADVWATTAVVAGEDLSWIAHAGTRTGLVVAADGQVRRWSGGVEVDVVSGTTLPELAR